MRIYNRLSACRQKIHLLSLRYRGQVLSAADDLFFKQALELQAALTYDLYSAPGFNEFYRNLVSHPSFDVFDFGLAVKSLATRVRQLPEMEEDYPVGWRRFTDDVREFRWFFAPIKFDFREYELTGSAEPFARMVQYIDFMSKVNLVGADLRDQCIAEYTAQEAKLSRISAPSDLIEGIRSVLSDLMSDFPADPGVPHHGNGATAELTRNTANPLSKEVVINAECKLLRRKFLDGQFSDYLVNPKVADGPSWTTSKLEFVPKSITTNRTISKEPTGLQFYQQAWKEAWYDWNDYRTKSLLRRIIRYSDQKLSSDLARRGSVDGSYATLDLSAASDSVSLSLVKRVFPEHIADELLACRSKYTTYTYRRHTYVWRLQKFAPMGSALCFPVESTLFAAICEYARRSGGHRRLSRVYGDDLVVPREYVAEVCDILTRLGFQLNEKKSHWKSYRSHFREACGGEYLNGTDVTPVRISRGLLAVPAISRVSQIKKVTSGVLTGWLGFVNRCQSAGLYTVRSYALRMLHLRLEPLWRYIPYTSDPNAYGVFQPGAIDNRPWRYNSSYQRYEHKTLVPQSAKMLCGWNSGADDNWLLYGVWQRDRMLRPQDNFFGLSDRLLELRPNLVKLRPEVSYLDNARKGLDLRWI